MKDRLQQRIQEVEALKNPRVHKETKTFLASEKLASTKKQKTPSPAKPKSKKKK